jgi:hypothetical protein
MSQAVHLSTRVEPEIVQYRVISGWAVAALVLGLLSPAAIVAPILWLIPAMGFVAALIAMRSITAAQGQKSGWYLALLGLMLAIFFGAAGPARAITRNLWLETRAERLAHVFVDLLRQNKPLEAHELTKVASQRKPLGDNALELIQKNPDMKREYERFLSSELVQTLLERGKTAEVGLSSASFLRSDEGRDALTVEYHITTRDQDKPLTLSGQIGLERTVELMTGKERWRVIPMVQTGEEQ